MSRIERPPGVPVADEPDPFRYGWKEDIQHLPDGTTKTVCTPLTLEDLLHPEENYKIMNGSRHAEECLYLWDVLKHRVARDRHALVLCDTGVYWEDPVLDHHSPDIAVIFGIREPRRSWPSFHVAEEGVRPALIIEVASPHYRQNDVVTKVRQYHQAGVPWYVIADRIQNEGPPTLVGLRYTSAGYEEFAADAQGRLLLEPLGLMLGVRDDRVALYDAATGVEQGDYEAIRDALLEAQTRAATAEERTLAAQQARKDAEEARKDAEQRTLAEQQARKDAEQRTLAAQQARKDAEERILAQEKARKDAEQRMLSEQQARKDAEERVLVQEKARKDAEQRTLAEQQARKDAEERVLAQETARRDAEERAAAFARQIQELQAQLQRRAAADSEPHG